MNKSTNIFFGHKVNKLLRELSGMQAILGSPRVHVVHLFRVDEALRPGKCNTSRITQIYNMVPQAMETICVLGVFSTHLKSYFLHVCIHFWYTWFCLHVVCWCLAALILFLCFVCFVCLLFVSVACLGQNCCICCDSAYGGFLVVDAVRLSVFHFMARIPRPVETFKITKIG